MQLKIKLLLVASLLLLGSQANAIVLTPTTIDSVTCTINTNCWTTDNNSQPDAAAVQAMVGTSTTLTELYKAEVPNTVPEGELTSVGIDSASLFGNSYQTTFSNSATDPEDALIEYISGAAISCPECYITIKDGNNSPALYAFDISNWNGTDDISIEGFWPSNGAISNVAIWGGVTTSVPEPATLALLGLGLIGISFGARRNRAH